jgi:16S rRNA (uracil1498-N3)-methyltransferase
MQQYFADVLLEEVAEYVFTKEQAHHARDVVRLDHETVRLVDSRSQGWFAVCEARGKEFIAVVKEKDESYNEPAVEITLCMALIRREKFELILQKAAELGVTKIVPFESSRCVVRARKEKSDRQIERYESILLSAAEQCKRNIVPEITGVIDFQEIESAKAEVNLACYENAGRAARRISDFEITKSVCVVIGPEGGFSKDEMDELAAKGFEPVTLGPRILRAETAALYALSVIGEGAME